MSKEEAIFRENVTWIVTSYMKSKCEKKSTERVRHSIQIAMNQFWIGNTVEKKQEEFLDKQIWILDEMRTHITINKQLWNNNVGKTIKSMVRKYLDWFREFIL